MESVDGNTVLDDTDSGSEEVPEVATFHVTYRGVTVSREEYVPKVSAHPRQLNVFKAAGLEVDVNPKQSYNPHGCAAAFRARMRTLMSKATLFSLQRAGFAVVVAPNGIRPKGLKGKVSVRPLKPGPGGAFKPHLVAALFPSDWESKVIGQVVTELGAAWGTFRMEKFGVDDARFRGLGDLRSLSSVDIALGMDMIYYFSLDELVQMFADHPFLARDDVFSIETETFGMVLKHQLEVPAIRLFVASRHFPDCDAGIYTDLFPTGGKPMVEGYGHIKGGVVQFHSSSNATDAVYTHSVKSYQWLWETTRRIVVINGRGVLVQVHADKVSGPYTMHSITLQRHDIAFGPVPQPELYTPHVPPSHFVVERCIPGAMSSAIARCCGMDAQNVSAVDSLLSSIQQDAATVIGQEAWALLHKEKSMSRTLCAAVNGTAEEAIDRANGFLVVPSNKASRAAVLEARASELQAKIGFAPDEARILATGALGSRWEFAISVGQYIRGKLISFGEWVSQLFARWTNPPVAAATTGINVDLIRKLGRGLFSIPARIVSKFGRVVNILKRMTVIDWLPFMDQDVTPEIHFLLMTVTSTVFEELLKRRFWWGTAALNLYEFVSYILVTVFLESSVELDTAVMLRLAVVIAHICFAALPLPLGIAAHLTWNYVAYKMQKAYVRQTTYDAGQAAYKSAMDFNEMVSRLHKPDVLSKRQSDHLSEILNTIEGGLTNPLTPIVAVVPTVHDSTLIQTDALGFEEEVMAIPVPPKPQKFKFVESSTTDRFMKPGNDAPTATVVTAMRFDEPAPVRDPKFVDAVHDFFAECWHATIDHSGDEWEVLSWDQLLEYVDSNRSWTKRKKAEIKDIISRAKKGVSAKGGKTVFTKVDELLLLRKLFTGVGVKARPIFPMRACQVPMLRTIVPFKQFLGTTWAVSQAHGQWSIRRCNFADATHDLDTVATMTFFTAPTAYSLSAWLDLAVRRAFQVAVAIHGDDNWTLLKGLQMMETSGCDLRMCDVTCHAQFQAFMEWFRLETTRAKDECREIRKHYMDGLSGRFRYVVDKATLPLKSQLHLEKNEASTISGQPDTSQLSGGVQIFNFPMVVRDYLDSGTVGTKGYEASVARVYKAYGLSPEFEPSDNHSISAHSFLGKMVARNVDGGYSWVTLTKVKSFLCCPNLHEVFGDTNQRVLSAKYAYILSTDPELQTDPLGRALHGWATRAALHGRVDVVATQVRWEKWLYRMDPYKADLALDESSKMTPGLVTDFDFLHAVSQYVGGWADPSLTNQKLLHLMAELQCMPAIGPYKLSDAADVWVELRYRQKCKTIVEDAIIPAAGMNGLACIVPGMKKLCNLIMSNANNNNVSTKPKKKAGKKGPSKKELKGRSNIGVGKGVVASSAKPNRNPMGLMSKKLTGQEAGLVSYLMGLSTPTIPCRVPVVLGEFELDTNTYSYVFNGTVSATATGFGYVGACPDGWAENGNDGGPLYQYLANVTQGRPVWTNATGGAAVNTASVGATTGALDVGLQLVKVDPALTAASRYRNTSIILSVWPDSPATTTQGDLCLAALASEQALTDAVLNTANFATLAALPQEYVSHVEMPLANWNPEHQAHAFPVPFSETCFTINYLPTTGNNLAGGFAVVAIISGAASGQTFRYRVEYKYETTAPVSYMTGQEYVSNSAPVSSAQLVPHLSAMKPMSTIKGPSKHLAGVPLVAMKTADPGLFSKLITPGTVENSLGKHVGKAIGAGVKQIPYVGNALGSVFDALFG